MTDPRPDIAVDEPIWAVHYGFDKSYPSIVCPSGDAELGTWMIAERVRWPAVAEQMVRDHNTRTQLIAALQNLRTRFHACCISSGSDPEHADAACAKADAAIAKAQQP